LVKSKPSIDSLYQDRFIYTKSHHNTASAHANWQLTGRWGLRFDQRIRDGAPQFPADAGQERTVCGDLVPN